MRGCKIGSQLFTAAGPAAVEIARKRGFRVFLDLKFHDIPNTVAGAVREATRLGVFMLNVHVSGGAAMMRAAAEAANKAAADFAVTRPLCLGVTVLTSLDQRALQAELGITSSVSGHVLHLATLSREAGLDGSVASPEESRLLRTALGRTLDYRDPGHSSSGSRRRSETDGLGRRRPDGRCRLHRGGPSHHGRARSGGGSQSNPGRSRPARLISATPELRPV